jgi:hypothetical protein
MPSIRTISVSGSIPSITQLALGDLAVNTFDGKAYLKKQQGTTQTVIEIGSGAGGGVTQIIAGTNITISPVGGTGIVTVNANNPVSASYALSSSYAANGGVTQLLAGSNITLSPTNGRGQVTISSTGGGGPYFNTATGSYGSFYDTTTQTNVANTARSMSFNTTDISNGVSISGSTSPYNTYIKIENPGVYDIQFSAQVDKTDSGTDVIWIWLRKNGSDLSDTNTSVTLEGNNAQYVAAWNWFVNSAAGDYYQIMWRSADSNIRLHAESATVNYPGIPSVILTVNRVDQFLSNTGSFSGSFIGSHTGSLFGTASYAATASYVNPLNQNVIITGSLTISGSSTFTNIGPAIFSGSVTGISGFTGSLSGSATSALTASYVRPLTQSVLITGSAGLNPALQVYKSGSTVVSIQGSQGELFSITDSLSGSLFSVSNISGLPILEVFSDNTVIAGSYINPGLTVTGSRVIATGSFSGSFTGAFSGTSSYSNNALTASYALSASYAPSTPFPYTGSAGISGSLAIKGGDTSASTKVFHVQTGDGTSIMDFRNNTYAFFGCGQGGGSASGFIFRYTDTNYTQFVGYNYGGGSGAYKPILLDTDVGGRNKGIFVNYDTTVNTPPASTEFAVRGQGATSATFTAKFQNSGLNDILTIRDDGNVRVTGSLTVTGSVLASGNLTVGRITSTPATENTLNVYPPPAGGTGEGGQILLAASGGLYSSASMLDNWQDQFRILRGSNTGGSNAGLVYVNLQTGNTQFVGSVTASAYSGLPNDYLYVNLSTNQTIPPPQTWANQDVLFDNVIVNKGIPYNPAAGTATLTGGKVYRITSRLAWTAAASYLFQYSCFDSANTQVGPTVEIVQSTNGSNNISDGTLDFIYAPGGNIDIKIRMTPATSALSGEYIRSDLNTQLIIQQIA